MSNVCKNFIILHYHDKHREETMQLHYKEMKKMTFPTHNKASIWFDSPP